MSRWATTFSASIPTTAGDAFSAMLAKALPIRRSVAMLSESCAIAGMEETNSETRSSSEIAEQRDSLFLVVSPCMCIFLPPNFFVESVLDTNQLLLTDAFYTIVWGRSSRRQTFFLPRAARRCR
jgi:hypothetical protein